MSWELWVGVLVDERRFDDVVAESRRLYSWSLSGSVRGGTLMGDRVIVAIGVGL